ncbi:MAG: glyoxylate/hydroxypyruvate reductase A [Geminicoccaceae bacterium]|nr:MAG: glyoxylate/hydroxypyruvate reductase A [Geminicoccaceae bacterium]
MPEEEIHPAVDFTGDPATVDVVIAANPAPDKLAPFGSIRFVQSLWAGVEHLVHNPALPPAAPLARLVDPNMSQAMAEGVAAHVLALHRDHARFARSQRQRVWSKDPQKLARERTVGFLGTGELARACMRMLQPLGFSLLGWSRHQRAIDGVATFAGSDGLQTMLGGTEILVNLTPLTAATRGLIDARLLAALPKGAMLINVARGGHVVEADLIDALDRGHLAEAVLDVFEIEPLPADHPFWAHPRIQVFPHVAAQTDPASAAKIAAANIRRFRRGETPHDLVDRQRGY